MAISRAQLAKELEPGLNALFGMEYSRYENQHAEIFTTEYVVWFRRSTDQIGRWCN
jgi:hypothetical protein